MGLQALSPSSETVSSWLGQGFVLLLLSSIHRIESWPFPAKKKAMPVKLRQKSNIHEVLITHE